MNILEINKDRMASAVLFFVEVKAGKYHVYDMMNTKL